MRVRKEPFGAHCDELISPDEKWELDRRDGGNGWLGPSHRS